MICKLDDNDYCQRHKTYHRGRLKELSQDPSERGDKYRRLWDDAPQPTVKKKIVVAPKKDGSIDCSIIMPSINEPAIIQAAIDHIRAADNPKGFTYEIVCLTDKVRDYGKHVVCIEDQLRSGSIAACNESLKACQGDWILSMPDGTYAPKNMFEIIDWIATEYQERTYKISSFSAYNSPPCSLLSFKWFQPFYLPLLENPKEPGCILRYPCGTRGSFQELGCFFNPSFQHRVGDNWLGIWLTLQGEPSRECNIVSVKQRPHKPRTGNNLYDKSVLIRLLRAWDDSITYGHRVEVKRGRKLLPL